MRALLLAQAVWLPSLVGWGSLWERFYRTAGRPTDFSLGELGLLGAGSAAILATLLNFVVPISPDVSITVCAVGWIALLIRWRALQPRVDINGLFVFAILAIGTSARAYYGLLVFDAGLYHFPVTEWARHPVLPYGLANLNGFAGYNSVWFAYGALLQLPRLETAALLSAEAILITMFYEMLWSGFFNGRFSSRGSRALPLLCLAFLAVNVGVSFEATAGSNSTDAPMAIYCMGAVIALVRMKLWRHAPSGLLGLTLGAYAVSVKLSAIGFLAFLSVGVLAVWWQERDALFGSHFFKKGVFVVLLIVVPWLVRGLWTSGCVAYPDTRGCVASLPWTASVARRLHLVYDIKSAAGQCLLETTTPARVACWKERWWPSVAQDPRTRLSMILFALGILGLLVAQWRSGADWIPLPAVQGFWIAALVSAGGIGFWFISAPQPRFGYPFFASLAAIALAAMLLTNALAGILLRIGPALFVAALSLGSAHLYRMAQDPIFAREPWPRLSGVNTTDLTLANGAHVALPRDGITCWQAPEPCAVDPEAGLVATQKGKRYMFRVLPPDVARETAAAH